MTCNRTSELLREGLTERGIEYRSGLEGVTFVGDWCFVEYDNGGLAATCEPGLTPEQAVAATLVSDEPTYDELLRCLENDWNIKASWDGLRKFWHIELTEEGAKLRDATHGTLTAEQVRECVQHVYHEGYSDGSVRKGAHIDETDWQAIADELNTCAERTREACAFSKPTDLTDGCAALERIAELEEECDQLRKAVAYWQRMYEEQIGVRR